MSELTFDNVKDKTIDVTSLGTGKILVSIFVVVVVICLVILLILVIISLCIEENIIIIGTQQGGKLVGNGSSQGEVMLI